MTNIKWKTFAFILLLGVMASVIYGLNENKKAEKAFQNTDTVIGVITKKNPSRSHSDIYVEYLYKGRVLHSEFSVETDTFKLKEKVILKVAKSDPEKYILFISKTK